MSESISKANDKFVRRTLSKIEVAKDFLQLSLPPKLLEFIDLNTLELTKDTFVDKNLKEAFSDVIYKVSLKNSDSQAYIYALVEHKSYPDAFVSFQLLKYMVRIWEREVPASKEDEKYPIKKLPPIIPIVLYHGASKWNISLNFKPLIFRYEDFEQYIPDFNYILCDLSEYDDDKIIGNAIFKAGMLILKYIQKSDLNIRLADILSLLNKLSHQSAFEYLETITEYLIKGTDKISEENLGKAIETAFPDVGGNIMATLAEKWFSDGKQEGRQEGEEIGEKKGREKTLLETAKNMLKEGLDMSVIKKITGLSDRDLQELAA
jgi:predicted transposase/invertase (TIGR01784 family)